MADPSTKFEVSSVSGCGDITWDVCKILKHDHAPFMEDFSSAGWDLLYGKSVYQI